MPLTEPIELVAGDVGATRQLEFVGVENLDAVTSIEAHIWRSVDRANTVTLAVELVDRAERLIKVSFSPWLATAVPGDWLLEVEAASPTDTVTSPSGKPQLVKVRRQGG